VRRCGIWTDGAKYRVTDTLRTARMRVTSSSPGMAAEIEQLPLNGRAPARATDLATVGHINDLAYGNPDARLERTLAPLPPGRLRAYVAELQGRPASVALALHHSVIEANVTEIETEIPAEGISRRGDLVVLDYQRLFRQRVPLPADMAARIRMSDPWDYAQLSETVEAWAFRLVQDERSFLDRRTAARRWFEEEYLPVVAMLHDAGLVGDGTDAEAYLRVACDRYRLIRTHEWSDEIVARLRPRPRRGRRA